MHRWDRCRHPYRDSLSENERDAGARLPPFSICILLSPLGLQSAYVTRIISPDWGIFERSSSPVPQTVAYGLNATSELKRLVFQPHQDPRSRCIICKTEEPAIERAMKSSSIEWLLCGSCVDVWCPSSLSVVCCVFDCGRGWKAQLIRILKCPLRLTMVTSRLDDATERLSMVWYLFSVFKLNIMKWGIDCFENLGIWNSWTNFVDIH